MITAPLQRTRSHSPHRYPPRMPPPNRLCQRSRQRQNFWLVGAAGLAAARPRRSARRSRCRGRRWLTPARRSPGPQGAPMPAIFAPGRLGANFAAPSAARQHRPWSPTHLAELAGQRAHATLAGPRRPGPGARLAAPAVRRARPGAAPNLQAAPPLTPDVLRIAAACGGNRRGERTAAFSRSRVR